ncbi:hypothetical protein BOX15_Mlig001692g2, partial [Macrostomum lignano]
NTFLVRHHRIILSFILHLSIKSEGAFMATLNSETEQARLKYLSGPQNLVIPCAIRPSRGAVSHQWRGPGFYQSETHRFTDPPQVTRDPVGQGLDKTAAVSGWPSAASSTTGVGCHAAEHAPAPYAERWRGRPVFFSAEHQTLSNEHPAGPVAPDARLFYNEDDWEKYKYMLNSRDIQRVEAKAEEAPAAEPGAAAGEQRNRNPNKPKERVWYF